MEDLNLIKKVLAPDGFIRTYSLSKNLNLIPGLCEKMNINILPGCALDGNRWITRYEIKNALELAKKGIKRLVIGDMVLQRGVLSAENLIQYLKIFDKAKVSTGQNWQQWLENPKIIKAVDFLCVGIYPYQEGIALKDAIKYLKKAVINIKKISGKKPIIIDSGWPSSGTVIGKAEFSISNQYIYLEKFIEFCKKNNLEYAVFEAFDEPWKIIFDQKQGIHLGIFNQKRQLKKSPDGLSGD